MRFVGILMFIFISNLTNAQDSIRTDVWVKVKVYDKMDGRLIENAQIISYETMQVFATDSLGTFRNVFNESDSLKIFGLGYDAVTVKVEDFKSLDEGMDLKLTRRSYMIRSVNVTAKKELHLHLPDDIKLAKEDDEQTPPSLRSDVFSHKPPVLAAVVNPISFVHYYTSKKEKMKRNAIKELAKANEQLKVNEFFNRDIIKEVSQYNESDTLTRFIVYCNVNLKVNPKDNPLLVKERILALKEKFEALKPELKE